MRNQDDDSYQCNRFLSSAEPEKEIFVPVASDKSLTETEMSNILVVLNKTDLLNQKHC